MAYNNPPRNVFDDLFPDTTTEEEMSLEQHTELGQGEEAEVQSQPAMVIDLTNTPGSAQRVVMGTPVSSMLCQYEQQIQMHLQAVQQANVEMDRMLDIFSTPVQPRRSSCTSHSVQMLIRSPTTMNGGQENLVQGLANKNLWKDVTNLARQMLTPMLAAYMDIRLDYDKMEAGRFDDNDLLWFMSMVAPHVSTRNNDSVFPQLVQVIRDYIPEPVLAEPGNDLLAAYQVMSGDLYNPRTGKPAPRASVLLMNRLMGYLTSA